MISFAPYDFTKYEPAPQPSLNGGLYSGEPFQRGAPWANFPVTPDTTTYVHENLQQGNDPPPEARFQYPPTRQGNSEVRWLGLKRFEGTQQNWGPYNIYCPPCQSPKKRRCSCDDVCDSTANSKCNRKNCERSKTLGNNPNMFSKYYYVP
jgi:hypothetical protein